MRQHFNTTHGRDMPERKQREKCVRNIDYQKDNTHKAARTHPRSFHVVNEQDHANQCNRTVPYMCCIPQAEYTYNEIAFPPRSNLPQRRPLWPWCSRQYSPRQHAVLEAHEVLPSCVQCSPKTGEGKHDQGHSCGCTQPCPFLEKREGEIPSFGSTKVMTGPATNQARR